VKPLLGGGGEGRLHPSVPGVFPTLWATTFVYLSYLLECVAAVRDSFEKVAIILWLQNR